MDFDKSVAGVLSANGKLVAFHVGPARVEVWDVDAQKRLAAHDSANPLAGLAFLKDGRLLALGKGRVTWFDPKTLTEVRSQPFLTTAGKLAWGVDPPGRLLAYAENGEMRARLRDLETENNRLKKLLAEAVLDNEALKVAFGVKR